MSIDQSQINREQHDIFITCPSCGEWLWSETDQHFSKSCVCGWKDTLDEPLPSEVESALIYMRNLIERVDFGLKLTANEQQLLAQAGVYAQGNRK